MAGNANISTESEDIHRNLLVKIESCSKHKSPNLFNSEDFYSLLTKKIQIGTKRRYNFKLKI